MNLVLDIGCGLSSETMNFLSKINLDLGTILLIGVDWSREFCQRSKERMGEVGISSEYVLCDAALLPFRDDVFDVVCFLDSLRCLKGNIPERFLEEAWRTLRSGGTLYITGLDKVTFKGKVLPIFKDARLPISWGSYVPTDRSEPWIDEEPTYKDLSAGRKFKYVGILPEHVARELLSECGVKSKTLWEVDQEEGYKFHRYLIVARKTQRLDHS